MRQPEFWQRPPSKSGIAPRILAPLGKLYALATAKRLQKTPELSADVPVICVGNLTVGGNGKTPTVVRLVEMLGTHALAVVSRGYGSTLQGPLRVEPRKHTADQVGDEPLLLAAFAPTYISKDRAAGARMAIAEGAKAIILDDGFQNPSVRKDLSIIVANAETGFGNGYVLPAGPLREPVNAGLARADILLTIGDAEAQAEFSSTWSDVVTIPRVTGQLEPLETGMNWDGLRVLAFAGIGFPQKFFKTLSQLGANVVRSVPLDDHQRLTSALIARLTADAHSLSAQLVTTEKDAVRLPESARKSVLTLPVRLQIGDESELEKALRGLGLL